MVSTIKCLRLDAIVRLICLLQLGVTTLAFEIIYNVCPLYEDHIKLNRQSLISCAQACTCFSGCLLAGYNGKTGICDIYESHPDIDDRSCPGYFLVSKPSATDIARRAYQKQCSTHDINVCQETSNGKMLLGNLQSIGSQRYLTCKPSGKVDGIKATKCLENGDWSELGTCKNVCPMFDLTNSHLAMTQIEIMTSAGSLAFDSTDNINTPLFEGTKATFTCMNGTLNGNEIATCVNGTWTQFPTCKGSMRKPCQTNSGCTDTDSECRNGKCWCKPKLSYDPCRFFCVDVCPGPYGDTFQFVERFAIRQSNRLEQIVADADTCMDLCLSDATYVCKYADYQFTTRTCKLNYNPTEGEPHFQYFSDYNFFQRDCVSCDL